MTSVEFQGHLKIIGIASFMHTITTPCTEHIPRFINLPIQSAALIEQVSSHKDFDQPDE